MLNKRIRKLKPFYTTIINTSKETIKRNTSSKNPIIKFIITTLYFLRNIINSLIRFSRDADFRSILFLQLFNSKNIHQTTSLTFMDRYPEIFSACGEYFNERHDIKILSFGCSTGEEVLSLRKYFHSAHIIGADINKRSLSIAKHLSVDKNINFIYSTPSELTKNGPFDAIFCMAVLQRKPHVIEQKGITNLKKIYSFDKFEKQVIELDKLLSPNGLMIIHYTQYSLFDTFVAYKYKPLGDYNQNDYSLPVFDKNSELIKNPLSQNTIFIKVEK